MLAYFDCFSGISGDMTLGAFVDLGVPVEFLQREVARLPLKGFEITASPVSRHGIGAQNVCVEEKVRADHTHYSRIKALIQSSPYPERVREISLGIFKRIAEAESKIHGCPLEKVHFHEVGAVDSIVDIVGTALCIHYLGIEKIIASPLPLSGGFVRCSHGNLPLPAPATMEILKNVPVYGVDAGFEMVTPTGAAIVSYLADSFGEMPPMVVRNTGYGSGKRETSERPNLLRIVTGTPFQEKNGKDLSKEGVVILESCIDDMNPEIYGFLMERLFEEGALDVFWVPVYMKKNRPGTMLKVVCREKERSSLTCLILSETTTLGVRSYDASRDVLERELVQVETPFGKVAAKKITGPDGNTRIVPEYEACRQIAIEKKIPLRQVYDQLLPPAKLLP